MASISVSFTGDSHEEVVSVVQRWLASVEADRSPAASHQPAADQREREVREVMGRVRGESSRELVLEVASAASRGGVVPRDERLLRLFKKTNYTAFAGMVGGPNKLMRKIARRDLISWDAALGGYRIDPLDAEVILRISSEEPSRDAETAT